MDFIFKSFHGSIILQRISINKESHFFVQNKWSRATLWFSQKYPSQKCGSFVLWWLFTPDCWHKLFFTNQLTIQDQKSYARLMPKLDTEFQSLPLFWNLESCPCWPLSDKWPLKLVWYSIYRYNSITIIATVYLSYLSMPIGKSVSSFPEKLLNHKINSKLSFWWEKTKQILCASWSLF